MNIVLIKAIKCQYCRDPIIQLLYKKTINFIIFYSYISQISNITSSSYWRSRNFSIVTAIAWERQSSQLNQQIHICRRLVSAADNGICLRRPACWLGYCYATLARGEVEKLFCSNQSNFARWSLVYNTGCAGFSRYISQI